MPGKTILILGGYGNTGRLLARLLLQETGVRLVLAGRTLSRADASAADLQKVYGADRVLSRYADASDLASLKKAFQGVDMVVVASSTSRYALQVTTAALEAGTDYYDINYSTRKIVAIRSLSQEIERAGRFFVTEGGFHPGLPALLVRYAAASFDRLEKANVGSVIKLDWSKWAMERSTVEEFLEEVRDFDPSAFRNGEWKRFSMADSEGVLRMDFGGKFGRQPCMAMMLEEMRRLPELLPSLKETGFYVGGFNWFVDWFVFPIAAATLSLWPGQAVRPMGKLLQWGMKMFSNPPYGTMLKLEAAGRQGGKVKTLNLILSHEDGYLFTAIPVAACLLQYLDGSIRKPGLWTQAHIAEPERLLKDMERLGVDIRSEAG